MPSNMPRPAQQQKETQGKEDKKMQDAKTALLPAKPSEQERNKRENEEQTTQTRLLRSPTRSTHAGQADRAR